MAAITTTLALLGLGLAGGVAAKSIADKKGDTGDDSGDDSHSPHAKLGDAPIAPPAAPPSLALTSGAAASGAQAAAARQRKKALGADLLSGPKLNTTPAKAKTSPASLLGY